jgi:hypothetical protein
MTLNRGKNRGVARLVAVLCMTVPSAAWAELGGEIDGTYVFAGGEAERAAHRAALDDAAASVSPVLRPIARTVLGQLLQLPRRIIVRTVGDQLEITIDPNPPRRSRLDGTATTFRNVRGTRSVLRRVLRGRTIHETAVAENSTRNIEFRFGEDNRRLTACWRVEVPERFPRPVRFRLTFERQ